VIEEITVESMLSNIQVYRAYSHIEQLAVLKVLEDLIVSNLKDSLVPEHINEGDGGFVGKKQLAIKLIVIDSIAFHFRYNFKDMALRSRLLTSMAQKLRNIASKYKIAVNSSSLQS
jgi:RAD51-like protein 2